ncbi:histidine kinase [Tumidithrix helvetica PCC 7403]|uniref:two-component system sensor histidine kinase RppB n=1 Tax=Tumidithrix helvetica TaxID=3457545 RepID=UPI003CA2F6DE
MLPMNHNSIFLKARVSLALWYAGVMGAILGLSGFGAYQVMAHAHWHGLDQELASVAGTLHDVLEPALKQPGQIDATLHKVLPNLCVSGVKCEQDFERHVLGITQQEGYYVRLLDRSGRVIATVGQQPEGIPFHLEDKAWQTLEDRQGNRYHQVSLLLKNESGQPWGYMQVGRSLKDYDKHLDESKLALLAGLPIAFLLVTIASWFLSGIAMKPVYTSYRQIQQFTADAAHELRTPLAAIRATVESTLREDPLLEAEAKEVLQSIQRQSIRFSHLIQDLLFISRMDLKVIAWNFETCCLDDITSDLVEELAPLAIAAGISLKWQTLTERSLYVLGDRDQLYRLISNLIINAIKYTQRGGEVNLILDMHNREATIQVQDTGIGIAEADLPRIFERFYRIGGDRSRSTGGSGLGLAIAQAIAIAHQGSIQVKSEVDKGSTFTVRLALHSKE